MNIFIVHSGCDKETVEKVTARIEELESCANILMLKNGGVFWKIEAGGLIKNRKWYCLLSEKILI